MAIDLSGLTIVLLELILLLLGTCQKLAAGRGGGDFQFSDEKTMTLPW